MISFDTKGDFSKTFKFLENCKNINNKIRNILEKYGSQGVDALSSATPVDSGTTASSWKYKVKQSGDTATIEWYNTNTVKGVNIAVILQYGHGTQNVGYVAGQDYINPAMKPIFDKIAKEAFKEVSKE